MLLPRFLDAKVKRYLQRKGYVQVRGEDPSAMARRECLVRSQAIDLVVDVGANIGQYGSAMRGLGYAGRIISFEPMKAAWEELQLKMHADGNWEGFQLALGRDSGMVDLHIAGNSVSSSLLEMMPRHLRNAPRSEYGGSEKVPVRRLDDVLEEAGISALNTWLKLDVQGFECEVLAGAGRLLQRSRIVQLEMSLVPLYAGQALFSELLDLMDQAGFEPVGFEPGFQEPETGVMLQVDGLFRHRRFGDSR
ncbi:FkbM family methyltransferase [Stenotrophomonas sp.]|uniref:FkbM family methyltransferase n=1 Tax=Stenotrophomonas sp. TaxID=69392 RepID=UPI0028AF0BC0|nr:FkbM family methyltransferase [Stenotrophomonas sp.]